MQCVVPGGPTPSDIRGSFRGNEKHNGPQFQMITDSGKKISDTDI